MKFLAFFHIALVIVFAALNGVMLYLFMLQLPYGLDPFLFSLASWDRMSPQIGYVAGISGVLAVSGAVLVQWLPEVWKNRLLYARWDFSHPSSDAFLTTRKQPFESRDLLAKFPMIKDSGFSRRVQTEVWQDAYNASRTKRVVLNTQIHWNMLRDVYVLSLYFLTFFLIGWLINMGVPFQIVGIYMFLFGTQTLFLLFAARRTGFRMVDNVLALALGFEEDNASLGKKRK
ncbi:hypothetical protein [Sedimenticola selenatireducens]|uniref:Glycosyl-4,4'-diaponeurosporenoate acyltransferase n=1 Tax=Sedimenticola selenatireducens TaxID=191960 RepID=A0A558DV41_9GAMM|nr:hypothetical protein [Sedimenticola selenatireducens]TVO72523.1 hypothetical protein FHP88_13110 [Sedimenticola selenatireducens]TVT64778.1 MAG: hypothetical protein FHK78_06875 [Sedimenticola selenatireducens]